MRSRAVAADPLAALKAEKPRVEHWQDKEAARGCLRRIAQRGWPRELRAKKLNFSEKLNFWVNFWVTDQWSAFARPQTCSSPISGHARGEQHGRFAAACALCYHANS